MARDESDREDLLAEATALVERAELRVAGLDDPLVAGFRRDGGLSLFFGADPVFQFTPEKELRRAFLAGELYKARSGHLVVMRRERTADQVLLVSRQVSEPERSLFLAELDRRLEQLSTAITQEAYQIVGQVPVDDRMIARLGEWMVARSRPMKVAQTPRAGGSAVR